MNEVYTLRQTNTKTFLVVGFENNFIDLIAPPPGRETDFLYFERINSSFSAFNWLQSSLDKGTALPHAIIVKYEFLVQDQFLFLDSVYQNEGLRQLPFIVIGDRDCKPDMAALIQKGVDDYFPGFVRSLDLQNRINFLRRYKKDILAKKLPERAEDLEFHIPLGKRLFDIVFASVMILLLSPIMIFIALAVKLGSKGPIIYKSKRVGAGYKVFHFLKFRSMCQDADAKLNNFKHLNHYSSTEDKNENAFFKLKNDPRITKIGRVIRKTSLDELPQLFNVLRGEMSIVGNRPLPLYEAEKMTTDQWVKRFWAPAGMTGLWQTCGKGKDNLTVDERVGLDIKYAEEYSMLVDARIIVKTPFAMIQKES
ncbi:MAG: sugar transferase [Bacteroidota bacterium]